MRNMYNGSRSILHTSHCNFSQFLAYISLVLVILSEAFGTAWAEVSYIDEYGETETRYVYTSVANSTTTWSNG